MPRLGYETWHTVFRTERNHQEWKKGCEYGRNESPTGVNIYIFIHVGKEVIKNVGTVQDTLEISIQMTGNLWLLHVITPMTWHGVHGIYWQDINKWKSKNKPYTVEYLQYHANY